MSTEVIATAGRRLATESPATLVGVLRARAVAEPSRLAYVFLDDAGEENARLTYGELDGQARAIAALLQTHGLRGERALLLYPPGLEFVAAFMGCLYAGVVAVPAYPPRTPQALPRLLAIARDARPAAVLTTAELAPRIEALAQLAQSHGGGAGDAALQLARVRRLVTDGAAIGGGAEAWSDPRAESETLAFLQYTSGSTAAPKGVMVSHGNLLHNEETIRLAFEQTPSSVVVGWLPLYHDMGLIGTVLQPLFVGAHAILMSPLAFLQKPLLWLAVISRHRATTSGGPNFAYDLCVRKITPEQRAALDLSSWEVAFNGAEPVRAETLERFAAAFAPCGFRREAFYPCYGLAEATLFVSGGSKHQAPQVATVSAAALEQGRVASVDPGQPGGRSLVSSGPPRRQRVVIVDPETHRECNDDRMGEIWIAGESVAKGYWRRPEATAESFGAELDGPEVRTGDRFLRTGDIGFLAGGELFIAGRLKDLIIIRGRNLYPQDLELAAERSHPAARPGCGAAFSIEVEGEERLVLVQELDRRRVDEASAAAGAIRRALAEEHEVQVHDVVLVRAGTIPKTSSGKIQRHACRAAYLARGLDAVEPAAAGATNALGAAAGATNALGAAAGAANALGAAAGAAAWGPPSPFREDVLAAPPEERLALVMAYLRRQAARVLQVERSGLPADRSLVALGLDASNAAELESAIGSGLGVEVPRGILLQGKSLAELGRQVVDLLASPAPQNHE
jgi:acyl-CoA synthetase (AMP-forming)/AMP-acid ligase II